MLRKLNYLGVAIVAPELLACMAGGQWAAVRRSIAAMRAIGDSDWTMIHGFYAEMGGFVLEDPHFPSFSVTTAQICCLVKSQYLEMPDVMHKEIWDKSKGDEAVKLFAFCQVGWAVLTILEEWAKVLR